MKGFICSEEILECYTLCVFQFFYKSLKRNDTTKITAQLIVDTIIGNWSIYDIISMGRLTYFIIAICQYKLSPFFTIIIKHLYRQFTRRQHGLIKIKLINNNLTTPHLLYLDNG